MSVGFSVAVANSVLDSLCRAVAWTPPAQFWVQLHIGDPGAAGTANPAVETTRQQVTFGAAAGGVAANTVAVSWTNVAASEDYTYWSGWSASVAGTFLVSGVVTANAVVIADTFTADVGSLLVTVAVAS